MSPRALSCTFVALFCLAASSIARAEDTWREVRSPHFRVLTNSSEGNGRAVALQFEQMRHVFTTLFNSEDIEDGAPLTIIAARDGQTLRELEPALWKQQGDRIAGEFHRGWEKQFALTRMDTWNGQNQVVIYHEYTHSILHANTRWLPTWLDEGLAEFYAYSRFEGDRTLIGAPSMRMGLLRSRALLPLPELLHVNANSPQLKDDTQFQLFYAQSWAMVHYMIFGPNMGNGAKLGQFLKKIGDRETQEQALTETFGDLKAFQSGFSNYLMLFAFQAGVVPPDPHLNAKSFTVKQLTPAQATYELACFHLGTRDRATAHTMFEAALKQDPTLAGAEEELGYAAFEKGDNAEAQQHWQRAISLDPNLPRSNFALIMTAKPLAQQTPEELRATEVALRHVTTLAPRFAPAFVELALIEWRQRNMTAAYKDARTAEMIEPGRAGYRILAGHILLEGKQPAMASDVARYVADHWVSPDHNEAVELWNTVPAADRNAGPSLAFDYPSGTTVARGRLTRVACATEPGQKFSVTLQPDDPSAAPLTVVADGRFRTGFSDTLWWGEDHFSMCHQTVGDDAIIAYKPSGNNAGTLMDLEIRDNFPVSSLPATQHAATPATSTPAAVSAVASAAIH